jgi:branched-chain amino acid transport system substrate-binding protein
MSFGFRWKHLAVASAIALGALTANPITTLADEQFFPLQSYRVGPYAAGGSGFFGGFIDYLNLVNIRDGGVNGVKLIWDEGETQYEVDRGLEVYERLKSHPGVAAWNPLSVGIAYAMLDRITQDKTPLITINHGHTDSTDGRVFPYVFPLLLNPYSETSGIVNYIADQLGGVDKLKGKRIVVLYHGSPYGKETIPIYELLAQSIRLRRAERGAASRRRAAVAMADDPPRQARLCRPARLGCHESCGAGDGGEGRLLRRSHRRQRVVELGRGRAACG